MEDAVIANPLLRELDYRSTDRIDVWLLWSESDDRLFVAVADAKSGDRFTIEVPDGQWAYDVFNHPFAYAASRGMPSRRAESAR